MFKTETIVTEAACRIACAHLQANTCSVVLACTHTPLSPLLLPVWLLLFLLLQLWEAALRVGAEAMLAGMGQVRKCSQQGRAAMSLDLSAVEKGLRPLAPAAALSSLRRVGFATPVGDAMHVSKAFWPLRPAVR